MKFTVNKLKMGDRVNAVAIESVGPNHLIVSFNGDLIRVENRSQKKIKEGERIPLVVAQVNPLTFHLAPSLGSSHVDLSI